VGFGDFVERGRREKGELYKSRKRFSPNLSTRLSFMSVLKTFDFSPPL